MATRRITLSRVIALDLLLVALVVLVALAGAPGMAFGQGRGAPSPDPILRIDTPMHQALIRRMLVDGRGERLVTAGDDKTIRIWRIERRHAGKAPGVRLVQTLRVPLDSGHEGQIFALAMSPDGTRIAAGGWTCWDWERAGCVYVFDVESGEIVRRLRGLPDAIGALAWSHDGRHLAIGLQGRAGLRIVRTDTFEEVAADRAYEDKLMELAYDARGRLAAVSLDGRIRLYRPDHRLHGRLAVTGGRQPAVVRFHPQADRLAVGFLDAPAVTVLDATSLAPVVTQRIDDRTQRNLSNVAWSADGQTLLAAGGRRADGPNRLHRWGAQGSGPAYAVAIPALRVSELQPLPGNTIAYSAEDPRIGIVDAQGQLVFDAAAEITDFSDAGFVLRANADGSTIGFTGSDGRERVFAVETPLAAKPVAPPMRTALTSAPGWLLERRDDRLALRVNGQPVALDDYEFVRSHAFDSAGDALYVGSEWALRRLDRQGKPAWHIRLAAIVRAMLVTADGQWVIAALSDGTIRWYRARDGSEVLSVFAHANGEDWIAWTPAGFYMSSLQGDQYVGWHVNRGADAVPDFHRAVQFERVLYRPDIVTAALRAGARPGVRQIASGPRFDEARLAQIAPPRLGIRVLAVHRDPDGTARARLRITGERRAQPLRELTIYVNDIPVTPAAERGVGWTESTRLAREVEVALEAGPNDIRVESFTSVSMGVAERMLPLDAGHAAPRVAGDLHIIAIGNNAFPNLPPSSGLEYAARDAEAFAATLSAAGAGTFSRVHLTVLSDERARKADRQAVLEALSQTRRARAEDTVVIFLASHGVSDRAGHYWFVPRDASERDLQAVEAGTPDGAAGAPTLISWQAFFDALRETAGRRLLIVDTCQAKGIEGRFESFALQKRSAASRFSLMVAAQSNEESQEYPPARHGLFTYALLQALTPRADGATATADADRDGHISIAEAFAAAAPLVERLHDRALGTQTPALIAPSALAVSPLGAARTPARPAAPTAAAAPPASLPR